MWIVCITSVRHVLTVNGYGGRQTKENEKSWCFKGWETLVINDTGYGFHMFVDIVKGESTYQDFNDIKSFYIKKCKELEIEKRYGE